MDDKDEIEYRYVKGTGWVATYVKYDRVLPAFRITATVVTDANGWQHYVLDQPAVDDFDAFNFSNVTITLS